MCLGGSVTLGKGQASVWTKVRQLLQAVVSWSAQLHRYTLVGSVVFLIDLGVYWLLMRLLGSWFLYAHFVSRTIGGVACFLLNRYVTFASKPHGRLWEEAVRFMTLYGVSFLLASILVYCAVDLVGMHPVTGKFTAESMVFLFNYTVMKYWVLGGARG